ncbi:MAG TPA: AtpZ/AtpI family protein [Candidatus Acidoferrales bacterium]|jgi:ATP synthase protein I|nr:AtpZ/AtpI family protein [Candidatus Acidoferrales bacterium]
MPSDNNANKDEKLTPAEQSAAGASRQFAMAMELPFILVAAIVVGGLVGYFLDNWLHTKPYLMLVFGILGFFGGLRDVLRRASK